MINHLTPVDYGIFVSLIAILSLFAQVADSMSPFIINYAAIYFAKNELGKAKTLFFKITKAASLIGVVILLLFILFSRQIGDFLNIHDQFLIVIIAFTICLSFIGTVNRGFIQAKLSFTFLTVIVFLGAVVKFSSGVLFVSNGLRVGGALMAFVVSFLVPYLLSFLPLRAILSKHQVKEHIDLSKMLKYGYSAVIAFFALTAFITTDVVLVKHFFSPELAGLYAGMTIFGKIIFFFSAPIGSVMFPLIVQKYAKNENYHSDFRLATFLIFLPSFFLTILFFFDPAFIIQLVIRDRHEYLAGTEYLGLIGIFFSLYSLNFVITSFYFSIQKTFIYLPILFCAILQGLLIWFFHTTLMQVYLISIFTSGLLLGMLLLYYFKINSSRQQRVLHSN